jgi:hypothetical protein
MNIDLEDLDRQIQGYHRKHKVFDIFNSTRRKVVCTNTDSDMWGGGSATDLELGKQYTVIKVVVHGWHTEVWLEEYPDRWYNSCAFEEIA